MNRIGEAINGCSKFELKRDLVRSYAIVWCCVCFSEIWHGCSCFVCLPDWLGCWLVACCGVVVAFARW